MRIPFTNFVDGFSALVYHQPNHGQRRTRRSKRGLKSAAGWTSTGMETYETRLEDEDTRPIQERAFVVSGVSYCRIPNRHEPRSKV